MSSTRIKSADPITFADVACMPYVALIHEGGLTLSGHPSIAAWVDRVKALPDFTGMPGV